MGVKGFKIDFIDRDDQKMVKSLYEIAKKAADHHLLVDYHGMYKPSGFQRTYPNVINCEGVKGLENMKWGTDNQPGYDVSIPFHPHDVGTDGLYPRRYAQCAESLPSGRKQQPHDTGHALPSTGDVHHF